MSDTELRELTRRAAADPDALPALVAALKRTGAGVEQRCRAGVHGATEVRGIYGARMRIVASWPDRPVDEPVNDGRWRMMASVDPVLIQTVSRCEDCTADRPVPSERVVRGHLKHQRAGFLSQQIPGGHRDREAPGHWLAMVPSCLWLAQHVFDEGLVIHKVTTERSVIGRQETTESWRRCVRCEHTESVGEPRVYLDREDRVLTCGHTPDGRLHGSEDACYDREGLR